MNWIIAIVLYFMLVWLFLRFFHFVAEVDKDIEQIQKHEQKNILH